MNLKNLSLRVMFVVIAVMAVFVYVFSKDKSPKRVTRASQKHRHDGRRPVSTRQMNEGEVEEI